MNVQSCLNREFMVYEFEQDKNTTETNENRMMYESSGAIDQ